MANRDAFGNYAPDQSGQPASNPVTSGVPVMPYAGNPTGVLVTSPNTLVIDTVHNTFYFTVDGTTWVAVGGSGGGGVQSTVTTADPEGVTVGNIGDYVWNKTLQKLFVKQTGNGTNTGWQQIV